MAGVFSHDFRQVRSQSGNRYKFREDGSQRICDDQLRRRHGHIRGIRNQLRKQRQTSAV